MAKRVIEPRPPMDLPNMQQQRVRILNGSNTRNNAGHEADDQDRQA
jgi:hypothetical protein